MKKRAARWAIIGWTTLFFARVHSPCFAQGKMPEFTRGDSLSFGEKLTIRSRVFGHERTVLISLPADYAVSASRYPVIYFTDGSMKRLCLIRVVVDLLADDNKMPQAIVVGIVQDDRNDELTPPKSNVDGPLLQFLKQELFPAIESAFRTVPSRIYVGHSRGGLFGLHCLLHDPRMFAAQINADPSLWWNDGALVNALEVFLKNDPNFGNSLYVSVTREMYGENGEYYDRLNEVMRRKTNPSFAYGFVALPPEESHASSPLMTLYGGLQEIFKGFSPFDHSSITFDDFQKRYSRPILGAVYNLTEGMINDFAYQKLRLKRYEEAIRAFKENTVRFPNSAHAFHSLGDAYFRAERLSESLASLDQAVELARKNDDENLARYVSDRDVVKEVLEKK